MVRTSAIVLRAYPHPAPPAPVTPAQASVAGQPVHVYSRVTLNTTASTGVIRYAVITSASVSPMLSLSDETGSRIFFPVFSAGGVGMEDGPARKGEGGRE